VCHESIWSFPSSGVRFYSVRRFLSSKYSKPLR
jgi:hypothetical protein